MCGRVAAPDNYDVSLREIRLRVNLDIIEDLVTKENWRPTYNLTPGERMLCAPSREGSLSLGGLTWGFLEGAKAINARAETVRELGLFREAFESGRCVAIVRGFYEWSGPKRSRQPHLAERRDGDMILLGALRRGEQCTVITVPASEDIEGIHTRMPLIIAPEDAAMWIQGTADEAESLLVPARGGTLSLREVSRVVNDPSNRGPECIEPPAQGSLF
jgi:putative SOS response-associated peptidase YedK